MPNTFEEIRLSQLDPPIVQAILAQLTTKDLRMLAQRYIPGQVGDTRNLVVKLSNDFDFTLTSHITLTYDQF